MLILDVNKLSKNYGYGSLFEGLSFSLNNGERISIVGSNGCGKSTLLKIIAGIERADDGNINIKKDAKVAYLDQTAPDNNDERLAVEVLKDAFSKFNEMQEKIDAVLKRIENEKDSAGYEKLINTYSVLLEKFQDAGGYEIETNLEIVCSGLKITKDLLQSKYNVLSGGEKTLIHLAKALLLKPDLFLLDEPTNHLDISRIEWLEEYIKSFKGAVVIVSHDRYFLDKMSNKILEIDNGEATVYATNYSGYLREKENKFQTQMANYKDQQLYFQKLEEQIKYFAQMGMAKNSSTMTKRAAVLQARLDREREKAIKRPREQKEIKMDFDEIQKSSKRVLEVKNLTVNVADRKIIDGINLHVGMRERVAIIGANGSGKSTFIKTILGEQTLPFSGEVFVGPSVRIGYLPQIINFANDKQPLLEYLKEETNLGEQKVRGILAGFGFFKEDISKKVGNLSGGERIRIKLAVLIQQQINTLIFDEPTNHIDIATKETLEETLQDFEGTLLFVSHDRFFINKFAQRIIEFTNGQIKTYIGNYEDYKQALTARINKSLLTKYSY